ncbi:hypothetical protein P691DRAFT_804153 [Macrolepiota fuliginosa MF-IS2]|uniref:Helicase sen1 n=1 Tax=Macrolepiota fuliginosa MF-IS2 TaxID=1400762 RepID=A0A9P6C769_9AGAR|nr:hypothetical protein P691DRAFT_804153 [Macrolepiota fuliginosa MF-IS2]
MENDDIQTLLTKLRDDPVDNSGATDRILARIYSYLLAVPKDKTGKLHWFCSLAGSTTNAAAAFLLRLFAYDGQEAETWRGSLHFCLMGCCDCVAEFEKVKKTSRTTYFAKFSADILDNFWESFDAWDVKQVLAELQRLGITPTNSDPMVQTLSDVSSPLVLRIMSNWAIFSDPQIQTIIHSIPPHTVFQSWPTQTIPPGILVLLVEQTSVVRQWASSQALRYPAAPLPTDQFTDGHIRALETLIYGLTSRDSSNTTSDQFSFFRFAVDMFDLWAGFSTALRFLPIEYLKSSNRCEIDIRKTVSGHLSDTDIHFVEVLRCFNFLLKRLEASFWADEAPEYALLVFDAVKHNSAFGKLVQSMQKSKPSDEKPWYLSWIFEYFYSVQKTDKIYSTVVAKISDFLLEELQHERFGDARPHVLESAARLLSSIFSKAHTQDDTRAMKALLSVVDIHANVLSRVALHRDYDKTQWSSARGALRQFLNKILMLDVRQISLVITETCRLLGRVALKKSLNQIPELSTRTGLWSQVHQSTHRQDHSGLADILCLVAEASYIDTLNKNTFEPILPVTDIGEAHADGGAVITSVNSALSEMRAGFLQSVKNVVDYSTSSQLSDLLKRHKVGKAAMLLLLSPVDDFHTTAKTLIGQAFDVDGRLECIRALLEKLPDPAIDGLLEFLDKFCNYAPVVPEACSLSKSLVRCFTDVIDTLCSKPDGLLHNSHFLRCDDSHGPASRLIELWTLMSKAIAVIFKRAPAWSVYFDNDDMIEWMRDALIFGRDMLAQWQVIEGAANAFYQQQRKQNKGKSNASLKSLSEIGQKMITCFQGVLTELTAWLRLTDEELLHQSFSLLQSLLELFRKTEIRPCQAAFTKLTRYVNSARNDVNQTRSRLDKSHITTLEETLAIFEDDDEIQIISEKIVSKPPKPTKQETKLVDKATMEHKPSTSAPPKESKGPKDQKKYILTQSKPTISNYFDKKDKWKLAESAPAVPAFTKQDKSLPTPGNQQTSLPKPKPKERFKNEAAKPATPQSSSESGESESENEAPIGGLASLGKKFAKSPKIRKPAERRQIKTLEISMGENIALARVKQREEARRAKMRMKPDISGLHRVLLSWNYDHDGPVPPGFDAGLASIPDVFMDFDHFHRIFEPLLLLECWAQIAQAKDEVQEVFECKITSKQYVDSWLELDISFEANLRKEWYLAQDTDVVLLRNPHTNKCTLAKTKSFTSNYQGTQASLRCFVRNGVDDPGLQISTSWKISKVFSLSTLHREYAALKSLPYYDFADTVLRPRLARIGPPEQHQVQKTMAEFKINEPQAVAILKSMKTAGFALIQGPPGTGKTSTICGLVSLALAKRSRPAVPIQVGHHAASEQPPLPKVLLCAPSNAAIDEIARRIKDGYRGPEKRGDTVKVVRIGTESSMNASVKDISLDHLVDQAIDPPKDGNNSGEIAAVRNELKEIREKKDKLYEVLEENTDSSRAVSLQTEIAQLNTRRTALASRMDRLKDDQKSASRTMDALRRSTRQKILLEADVICSTLSGAGHEVIEQLDFDMIIIDEAAQAIELSTLIPLKYKCQRCVLVGDPQQLPPTVLSQEAGKYRYNQSLFVRMQKSQPDAVHLLSIQYRMHPDISQLPSAVFYEGRLKDGPKMAEKTIQPWHTNPRFGTYKFFNISKGLEEASGRSIKNVAECHAAVALFNRLSVEYTNTTNLDHRIGVVSMYRAQIMELKRHFEQRFGKDILRRVDFNTVDGFQGQEKDVIILSCVRAGPGLQSVGFLSDTRRMNVALTRAKSSLYILGNAATLERSDANWRAIVGDARSRSCLIEADHTYFTGRVPAPTINNVPKPPKQTPTSASSVPTDLVQPQDFKQTKQTHASASASHAPTSSNNKNQQSKPQVIGVKRSAEEGPSNKRENDKRPPQPPAKRPKKAPNLFIPKNKKS